MAFAKKLHLDTGLANQMVDRLAIPVGKVQKCSRALVPVVVDLQQTLSTFFQAKQPLHWEFFITLQAPV